MIDLLCLVFLPFAVARLTRVVVDDSITVGFRRWVIRNFGEESGPTTLVHCPWCSAWWISWLVTIVVFPLLTLPLWMIPLVAVAVAQVAPMIMACSDRLAGGS